MEGVFRNPTVEFLKDNTWQFTEKIDGTNIRVHWNGHKVLFGGRTEDAQIPSHLLNKLIEMFGTDEAEQIFEQKFGEMEVMLFGEGYGPKIQKGGNYRNDVSFILFDVLISGNYQPRESVEDIAKAFGIDVVPIVLEGTIQDGVDFVKAKPKSTMGTAMMEGVVGRPKVEMRDRSGKRIIVKIKVKDFK
jgi:ATP-dependent RNA circularization protein (DNA/RNA ligase family)